MPQSSSDHAGENDRTGEIIKMAHGAGGQVMQELISGIYLKHLANQEGPAPIEVPLSELDDSAVVDDIVFTTDSHAVKPLFFPGGDMGSLAVAGTVNDIAVMGAEPVALSSAMIISEGFPFRDLDRIVESMGKTARYAGVPVITGDTKVVDRDDLQGMFCTTSGVGRRWEPLENNLATVRQYREFPHRWMQDSGVAAGDTIILSGSPGEHGIALLSHREGYEFDTLLESDAAPLNRMIAAALRVGGVTAMKDPTRGGVSNTLNEWSEKSGMGIIVREEDVPWNQIVSVACDMLGLDPLEIGNEGKCVLACVPEMAEEVLKALRSTAEGRNAAIIGKADSGIKGVVMETSIGGRRVVTPPLGDPIPRIC